MKAGDRIADRYELALKIGSGGFGAVWKAIDHIAGGIEVAIKIYAHETGLDESALHQFRKEYTLVMDLHHPHLLTAKHFDIWESRPFLIFPLMTGGSLYSKIYELDCLNEEEIATVLMQVADALAYLHENDIIHQDIKPDNVLIDSKGRYLLTDFGISSRMRSTLRRATGVQNSKTISFAPPERFGSNQIVVEAGDIFSLGVMVYEMATASLPWMGMGGMHLMPQSELPNLPEKFSEGLNTIMKAMLNYYPERRPTAKWIKEAALHYQHHGVWPAYKIVKSVQESSVVQPVGRQTSVFSPDSGDNKKSDSKKTVISDRGGSPQNTMIFQSQAVEDRKGAVDTEFSPATGRKSIVAVIAAVIIGLGGVVGWIYHSKQKQFIEIQELKQEIEKMLADGQFKKAYLMADSLANVDGFEKYDFFSSLRTLAADSMNARYNFLIDQWILSHLSFNKDKKREYFLQLIENTVNKDSIAKYENLIAALSAQPEPTSPVQTQLTPPDQLFGKNSSSSQQVEVNQSKASAPTISTPSAKPSSSAGTTAERSVSNAPDFERMTFYLDGSNAIIAVKVGRLLWSISTEHQKKLRNNVPLKNLMDKEEWINTLAPAYYLYNGTLLINGIATYDGKICPDGWRLPTESEWISLLKRFENKPDDFKKLFDLSMVGYRNAFGDIKDQGYAFFWVADAANTKASGKYGISVFIEGGKLHFETEKMLGDIGHTGFQCRCIKEI